MPVFLLSTISSLIHDMIYSLICSRTIKGLNLGELIHAFCIIIIASYKSSLHCYLHWSFIIYAFLDDLWDFPTNSLVLVFNIWEAENLLFHILMFQGPKRRPNDLIFCGDHFLEGTKRRSQGSTRKEVRGGFWGVPHGQIPWPRESTYLPPRCSDTIHFHLRAFVLT